MGKKAKVGKARRDRFYHLAKETGYRSRAAFKLIQLNRKFEFLQKSNVIIDLCAAPGGWLQVAAENAPMSNHIIGIDLVPINPIKNVKTLQEDITTEKCRQALRKELHTVKADIVMNDGAPNVGTNWINDAYQQAELTLHAVKLATEFLRKGGWFVTKVFRSKDYDALLWVFQQLFKNVHATKPQASRNESAEIFVVCQNYLAPDKIDPKFLNPKYAFKEIAADKKPAIDLIHPGKKRRNREGYPEGDYTLFHSLPVTEFFASTDFMTLLAESSEIKLDLPAVENHPLTTTEIKECLKDIKLLGKREIKSVFSWRKKLKKILEDSGAIPKPTEESKDEVEDTDTKENGDEADEEFNEEEKELAQLDKMLEDQSLQELREMKKAKKKVKKAQMKQKARIDLKMAIPGDRIDIEGDQNMFNIKKITNKTQLTEIEKGDLSFMDEEEDSEDELPMPKKAYFDRDEKKYVGVGEDTDEEEEMEEEPSFDGDEDQEENDDEDEDDDEGNANPLLVDMGKKKRMMEDHEDTWFSKSVFADLEKDGDEDIELGQMGMDDDKTMRKTKSNKASTPDDDVSDMDSDEEFSDDYDDSGVESKEQDSADESEEDSDYDFTETSRSKKKKKRDSKTKEKVTKFDGIEVVAAKLDPELKLDADGLAIGAAMVQSRKRKREIIDSGYHRFMYDDDGLPDWFVKEEKKHTQRQMPVTKEELEEYRLKTKAIDAQPIKKIAEAKARKKKRIMNKLEKARKKANTISDNVDVSEKEKWNQMKHVYKKAGLLNKTKEPVTYVKAKRGAGKKVSRPAGVKGKFKVVDGRMKKDVRSQKKADMRKQKSSTKSSKRQNKAKSNRRVRR